MFVLLFIYYSVYLPSYLQKATGLAYLRERQYNDKHFFTAAQLYF